MTVEAKKSTEVSSATSTMGGAGNDYALEPVPESAHTSGVSVGMVNGALAFAVPGLITGIEIGQSLGFWSSVAAFLVGGLLLALFGVATARVAYYNRLTSFLTLRHVFGRWGAKLVSLCFVFSLMGWYGVNLDLFALAVKGMLRHYTQAESSTVLIELSASVVIVITTLFGFKKIEKLSAWLVPVMGLVTFILLVKSATSEKEIAVVDATMSFGTAVSAVVGSFIVSIVLMPDLARFCRTKRDTWTASILPFFLLSTFVYIAASLAASVYGSDDILALMIKLGLGVFAFILLICSSWLTNVVNLYSASLGAVAVVNSTRQYLVILIMGLVGAVASSLNILEQFSTFLFSLSVLFTPVAAIYCCDFFILRKGRRYKTNTDVATFNYAACLAWFLGVIAGSAGQVYGVSITPIEALDALLVSFFSYLLAARWLKT